MEKKLEKKLEKNKKRLIKVYLTARPFSDSLLSIDISTKKLFLFALI